MKLSRSELQLESIVRRIVDEELDLQPDFQRGEIWDIRRRQRLIDTILRGWYVPAVHIVQDVDGDEVVLDGQQRLAAIRDFFGDRFSVDGRIEPSNGLIQDLHGRKFSKLPEHVQRALKRFVLQVITLTEFEPQEPNELFFRLNQSYNLTPPEKRNALHGPARDSVKSLVERLSQAGLLCREMVGFANGRLAYDDIIARTCVALERNTLQLHINNNVVEEFYRGGTFSEDTLIRVEDAGLELLAQIHAAPGRVRFNKGSLFTWLVYLDWAPRAAGSPVPEDLLSRFEFSRARAKDGSAENLELPLAERRILELVSLYEDRASYRVTDVSSVLIRDLVLHLYASTTAGDFAARSTAGLISDVVSGRAPVQALVGDFLSVSDWGSDLRSGVA